MVVPIKKRLSFLIFAPGFPSEKGAFSSPRSGARHLSQNLLDFWTDVTWYKSKIHLDFGGAIHQAPRMARKRNKHGLSGGGTRRSIRHSDVHNPEHLDYQKTKLHREFYTRLVPIEEAFVGDPPDLLEGRQLTTPGDLAWLIVEKGDEKPVDLTEIGPEAPLPDVKKDVKKGKYLKAKRVSGAEMTAGLEEFDAAVRAAGGPMRLGDAKKAGGNYLKKAPMDAVTRNTIHLPLWISWIWSNMSLEQRQKALPEVIKIVFKLARDRWPQAEFKAMSLHDDTGSLHFDIWASALEESIDVKKGIEKKVYVSKGKVFQSGLVGPGITFLELRKRAGHVLHPIDSAKLDAGLAQYQAHRELTKKPLPEIPAEIDFNLKLDEALLNLWMKANPKAADAAKKAVLEFWKANDAHKYGRFDKLAAVEKEKEKLVKEKAKLSEDKWEFKTEKEATENAKTVLQQMIKEAEIRNDELAKAAEEYARAGGSIRVVLAELILNSSDKGKWLRMMTADPVSLQRLADNLKPSTNPKVKKLYELVLVEMGKMK